MSLLLILIKLHDLAYVCVGKLRVAVNNSKSVLITNLTDKSNITLAIFTVSLSGEFLPLLIIYSGKTLSEGSLTLIKCLVGAISTVVVGSDNAVNNIFHLTVISLM